MATTAPATTAPTPPRLPLFPLGIVAILVALVLWPLGARYSLEGWIAGLNLLLELLRLPARIPVPSGWHWLWFIPVGVIYSSVELIRLGPPSSARVLPAWSMAVVLIILIHASDIGSTFFGYLYPPAGAWAIHTWAAGPGRPALALWAIGLTYLPEYAFYFGLRWIGVRSWKR